MRVNQPLLLVGSVAAPDAESAMRLCAAGLGEQLAGLPDGETGYRKVWINFLAMQAFDQNEAMETVNRPHPVDPGVEGEWRAPGEHWIPRGYDDHWLFRVADAARLSFDTLGYAAEALESYATFRALKAAGVVPEATRFMVSLPLGESATRFFAERVEDYAPLLSAYRDGIVRDIEAICAAVPAEELLLQWDVCVETLAIECNDDHPVFRWRPDGAPFDRYLGLLEHAGAAVPADVPMGLHLCYGDLGHQHLIEPPDLSVCVRMANAAPAAAGRPVDFYHVPVPRERKDDAYFAPLADLTSDGKMYLGLIHHTDGEAGTLERLAAAKRHAAGFGLATECGFGRRPADTMDELLAIHRAAAAAL